MFNKKLKKRIVCLEDRVERLYTENRAHIKRLRHLECPHTKTIFVMEKVFNVYPRYIEQCACCEKQIKFYRVADWKIAKAIALQAEVEELLK